MCVELPEELLGRAGRGPGWARWLRGLPRLVEDVCAEWQLVPDGQVRTGETAAVLPVRTDEGVSAAAKFVLTDAETAHEHLALRAWAGRGAVRLLRADPRRGVLLLERAEPDVDLHSLPVLEACEVVADLYGVLHRPALPQLDRLSGHATRWARELAALRDGHAVPRRFVDQAVSLATELATDPATDATLIHTDLHYANVLASARANVLAAPREPWLVIDPKPLAGDPAYEVAPLLWNRWADAVATGNLRAAVLNRFYTVVDRAGLDEDRARAWVVVRELVNVKWCLRDADGSRDPAFVTAALTIVKAVQREG